MGRVDLKNKAKQEKINDKEASKSANKTPMITVDVQAVQSISK